MKYKKKEKQKEDSFDYDFLEQQVARMSDPTSTAMWDKSKFDIGELFIYRMNKLLYKNFQSVIDGLTKTYLKKDQDYLVGNLKTEGFESRKNLAMLNKFLNDKVLLYTKADCKEQADFYDVIAEETALRLINKYGNLIGKGTVIAQYGDYSTQFVEDDRYNFSVELRQALKRHGFEKSKDNPDFYVCKTDFKPEKNKEYQMQLLNTYRNMVQEYLAYQSTKFSATRDQKKYWEIIEQAFKNIEDRLTPESKKFAYKSKVSVSNEWSFAELKAIKDNFFENSIKQAMKNQERKAQEENLGEQLKSAIGQFKQTGEMSDVLKKFIKNLKTLDKALELKNGAYYPCNYYRVMKEAPMDTIYAVRVLGGCKSKLDAQQNKDIESVANKLSLLFKNAMKAPVYCCDLRECLNGYKNMVKRNQNNDTVIDCSTEEKYLQFVDRVKSSLDTYDLPYTKLCITSVVNAISQGREAVSADLKHSANFTREK